MRLGTCLLIGGHTPQGALHKLADFCSAPVAGFYSAVDSLPGGLEAFTQKYVSDIRRMRAQGHVIGGYLLAREHYSGRFITQDRKAAYTIWRELADAGFPYAQFQVACHLDRHMKNCDSVEKNNPEASTYYDLAMRNADSAALNTVGFNLCSGEGYPVNITRCLELLEKAALLGNTRAANNLGNYYARIGKLGAANTKGKNPDAALKWYQVAADCGNIGGMENILALAPDSLEARMFEPLIFAQDN